MHLSLGGESKHVFIYTKADSPVQCWFLQWEALTRDFMAKKKQKVLSLNRQMGSGASSNGRCIVLPEVSRLSPWKLPTLRLHTAEIVSSNSQWFLHFLIYWMLEATSLSWLSLSRLFSSFVNFRFPVLILLV